MNTFIQKGCIKLIKSDSKDIYKTAKVRYFKTMLFFWTFYSSKNPEKVYYDFHKNIKHLFSTLIRRNVTWALN